MISRAMKIADTITVIKSAIGPEYRIPTTPKKIGRKIISGKRKITCRVKEMKSPFCDFPTDVK